MIMFTLAMFVAATADPSHPAWMVGTWGWQNRGETGIDCGSDHDTTYHADGRYSFIDTSGTWRIEGNRLIETMTDPGESDNPADRGKPNVIRFKRIKHGVLEIGGEYPGKMIKCPSG